MAGDDVPENEQPEIIPKPPSHPITSTLLIVAAAGQILCIALIWTQLFGVYLISPKFKEVGMEAHDWNKEKNLQGSIDHYTQDFPGEDKGSDKDKQRLMEYNVKKELHLLEEAGGGQ